MVNAAHPLRSKIFSYYDSMVASIQKHTVVPSFCNRSAGSAKTLELEWDGSKYTTTLTDTNNVLSNYSFSATISGVSFCFARVNDTGEETFGLLCFAEITEFAKELHSEMEKVVLMDELPENWTYPLIQPKLIEKYLQVKIIL